jgi:hypothetical protein
MSTPTTELLLLEDLEQPGRAGALPDRDREALQATADWIRSYVLKPHPEIGRPGPVCPYLPVSVQRQELWLAAEHVGDGDVPDVIEIVNGYKRRLLDAGTEPGDDANLRVIVVVFPDLPAERAPDVFDGVMQQISVPSYAEDGIIFGPYYDGNQATAVYNNGFRPFESPVPFLFVRHTVVGDWKFFLDQPEWFGHWAHRFGESATHALADELRRLPWNARRG